MKKRAILAASVAACIPLALCACPPSPPLPPEPTYVVFPPYDDAGDEGLSPINCSTACANLARLRCPEAQDAGDSCATVCEEAMAMGMDLNLLCVVRAMTQDQVRECQTVRCGEQ